MFRRRRDLSSAQPARVQFEQSVQQAIQLFQEGRYDEAGALYEQLARIAAARNGPRAPRFFLEAGRSWAHAHQINRAMELLEAGRQQAIRANRLDLLARLAPGLQADLERLGFGPQARVIASWGSEMQAYTPASSPSKRPSLPLKCPSCGAPVHPAEVHWIDNTTAECDFCGSPMRGT